MTQAAQLAQYGASSVGLAFKNRIINGGMVIAQRGTSVAVGTSPTYFVDRFAGIYSVSVTGTLSQQSSGRTDFPNCARAQRTSGQTATGNMTILQVLESSNCVGLAGQPVVLSFWARAGSNYSASSNSLAAAVYTGTGTDQSAASLMAGSWTGQTAIINSGATLTTSWQKFSVTGTAGSTANQFAILFQGALTGTAGANDFFEVTGVQLEVGSTATSFDYRPYGTEFDLCRRYFEIYSGGTVVEGQIPQGLAQVDASDRPEIMLFYYPKRTGPTISASGNFQWNSMANTGIACSFAGTYVGTYTYGSNLFFSASSGITPNTLSGVGMIIFGTSGGGSISISAEL